MRCAALERNVWGLKWERGYLFPTTPDAKFREQHSMTFFRNVSKSLNKYQLLAMDRAFRQ